MNDSINQRPSVGIVVIGQTPRPDVENTYRTYLPGARISIKGALDGLDESVIQNLVNSGAEYPLWVVLSGNRICEISQNQLIPFIERKVIDLDRDGAEIIVVMCASDFPDLSASIPIVYPSRIISAVVRSLSISNNIGIITPNPGQLKSACANWRSKGFNVKMAVASPRDQAALESAAASLNDNTLDLIVLDCMSFSPTHCHTVKRLSSRRTLCPKTLVARIVAELLGIYG